MVESGLLIMDHQLTVALILFVAMLCLCLMHPSVFSLMEAFHQLMMAGTSVVSPLIVQMLTLASFLLIYIVSILILHSHLLLGWAQIEDISVDLPSDITVLPQNYTLHAVKNGYTDHEQHNYAAEWYYESSTILCDGYKNYYQCSIGVGAKTHQGGGKYNYAVTIAWNGKTITSGQLNPSSNNGDQKYRFHFHISNAERNRTITVRGELEYLT